mmetsp:Transcript_27404/g.47978  ORF Transcript_27404/g.47978 Transcript_27404/m.47978 type:complete len:374 (+) Transcript_27404:86-1207(+)
MDWLSQGACYCCHGEQPSSSIEAEIPGNVAHHLRAATDPNVKVSRYWRMTSDDVMLIDYTEIGDKYVQYSGTAVSEKQVTKTIDISQSTRLKCTGRRPEWKVKFYQRKVTKWGINFAATIKFDGTVIYLPGFKTYDPAGVSNDGHGSERLGASCASSLLEMFGVILHAAVLGCDHCQLEEIADLFRDEILQYYHGRETLFSWMVSQLQEAREGILTVTSYPDHLQEASHPHVGALAIRSVQSLHNGDQMAKDLDKLQASSEKPSIMPAAEQKPRDRSLPEVSESRVEVTKSCIVSSLDPRQPGISAKAVENPVLKQALSLAEQLQALEEHYSKLEQRMILLEKSAMMTKGVHVQVREAIDLDDFKKKKKRQSD